MYGAIILYLHLMTQISHNQKSDRLKRHVPTSRYKIKLEAREFKT